MMKMRLKDKVLNIPMDMISFTILSFDVRLKKFLTHVFSKHEYIPFHFDPLYVPQIPFVPTSETNTVYRLLTGSNTLINHVN